MSAVQLTAGEAARVATFAVIVLELCYEHSASVSSWIRTTRKNHVEGGHPKSFHLEGVAADLVPDRLSELHAIGTAARERGLQIQIESTHVHIELDYRTPLTNGD